VRKLGQAAFALLVACAQASEAPAAPPIGQWNVTSGAFPPESSWTYAVTFSADQKVTAKYCLGYATTAPGCATAVADLTAEQFASLQAQLGPITADMVAHPPQEASVTPEGSPATFLTLFPQDTVLNVPAFPAPADGPRVSAAIALLQSFTPEGLVDKAKSRAR
jgi:hypothetical protein